MTRTKQAIKVAISKTLVAMRKVDILRYLLDKAATLLSLDPELKTDLGWADLDRSYTFCRRQLHSRPDWRYGPTRVHQVAKEGFQAISQYTGIHAKTYCDLGCGIYHPYGISVVMYLNGAASTIALDLHETDNQRAAEAIADLLCDCICLPELWNWSGIDTNEFLRRAKQFDLCALRSGRLNDGLKELPLKHVVTDIHKPALKEGSIDLMTSRGVLEHFLDFGVAVDRLFALMRSGGVAFHHIDLVDHRAYENKDYHYWSFLAEKGDWTDGIVNRLRSCEIRLCFERAGFQVLRYENRIGSMPDGFKDRIVGRFRQMSEEELNVIGIFCVMKKP